MHLAPWKTFIGLLVNKFWGFSIDTKGGAVLSDRNLKAIREAKPPNNAAEVASLVCMLTQNRRWVNMFSDIIEKVGTGTAARVRHRAESSH